MVEHPAIDRLVPGMRVRITQAVGRQRDRWSRTIEGELLSCGPEPTGSWHADGKQGRYWLTRVVLRKPDGELTRLSLDQDSRIEIVEPSNDPPPQPAEARGA